MFNFEEHKVKEFEKNVWLSSPTMHGEEFVYMKEAYDTNWMSTVGQNITTIEEEVAKRIGVTSTVALACGTATLHLCVRLAAERIYGRPKAHEGALRGRRVFCSDMTFSATVNPVAYEEGEAIFIDSEKDTWNMDPAALEKAFELFPDVKIVVLVHLYGTPAKIDEIKKIIKAHGAVLIEDAAEALGATYKGQMAGSFGDYNAISFNGNKIITGSSGGMFLSFSQADADLVRKWSTQSRELAAWYQHTDLGYNYRMSNVIAGVVRGQLPYLAEHVSQKRAIWERYKSGLAGLPLAMNPWEEKNSEPNFWLSCLTVQPEAMCEQNRDDLTATFVPEKGKSCPTEILQALNSIRAEGRPIWKPMHMQPVYMTHHFITAEGEGRDSTKSNTSGTKANVGADIFRRGLCLPSDNKMTPSQQDKIIEIIHRCFL